MVDNPRVFVSRRIPDKPLDYLRDHCEVTLWDELEPPPHDALVDALTRCDGAITMVTDRIDGPTLDAAPQVKVISNFAVGYDNIDVPAATERGVPIGHTPGVLTEACADHTFALLLAAARRISESERYVRDGKWRTWHPLMLLGTDVCGKTLGIIGFGRIGQAVARRARGFDMQILYSGGDNDAAQRLGARSASLDDLLQNSDFVSVHVPLKEPTRHLIGTRELALMRDGAVLINTSRGPVVDTDALLTALQSGRIRAALDVVDPEPIPVEHPLVSLDNCLIVPHLASATQTTREQMGMMAVANLLAGLRNERLPNCVNPAVYSRGN